MTGVNDILDWDSPSVVGCRTRTINYQPTRHPVLKRNFEVFPACDWLAALTTRIRNAGEHLVWYYGW